MWASPDGSMNTCQNLACSSGANFLSKNKRNAQNFFIAIDQIFSA